MKLIDKFALVAEIKARINDIEVAQKAGIIKKRDADKKIILFKSVLSLIDTLEVKEVSEELAETYMQIFEKKFSILPTLKGKQLSKFKNFLNKCQQTFGLQEFGIYPIQAKLFEKLTLLWAAWGAENLQGIGQVEGESDEVKEVDLEKEIDKFYGMYRKDGQTFSLEDNEECVDWKVDCNPKFEKYFAKYFFELGLKAAQKRK